MLGYTGIKVDLEKEFLSPENISVHCLLSEDSSKKKLWRFVMKRSAKILMAAAVFFLAVGMLFAAGQQEAEAGGDVTISFWHFPQVIGVKGFEDQSKEYGQFWAYLAEEFSAMDNGIKVETELIPWTGGFERFNVAIAGGNPPTIGFDYLGRTPIYYASGMATPADEVVPALVNDTDDSIVDIYTLSDGHVHALPAFSWSQGQMVVNVGLLKKYGWTGPVLNGPGQPFSFDEMVSFLEKAKKIVPSNVFPTVWSCGDEQGDYLWMNVFSAYGYKPYDADGKITSDISGMIKGYNLIKELQDKGLTNRGIASMKGNEGNDVFTSGLSVLNRSVSKAMITEMQTRINEGTLDFEFDLMVVPYPTPDGDYGYSALGPTAFIYLTKDQKELDAAAAWTEFVMQEKYWPNLVAGTGQLLLQKRYADLDLYTGDPLMEVTGLIKANTSAMDFGLTDTNYQKRREAMAEAGQKIFTGMASVEDAVKVLHDQFKALNKE
jgi:ABC-type glycerol-3-phosphate transport system substrate-binding protein